MDSAAASSSPVCTDDSPAVLIPPAPDLVREEVPEPPALGPVDTDEAMNTLYAPVPVETATKTGEEGWKSFTTHIEKLLEMMEKCIWPVDPDADIMPHTLMPFSYGTPTDEEDEEVLKGLLMALTLGLQGQAFNWRYKFDFDVVWSTEDKAYLVFLNSVRRMWNRGLSETAPETIETAAAETTPTTAESADFTPPAASTE